jgi:hypothetical protein
LPFLAFWWAALAGHAWLARRPWIERHWLLRALPAAPAALLFIPTVFVSGLAMIAFAFTQLNISFLGGHTWDLFTPLIALSLEGMTDAFSRILGITEEFVVHTRRRLFRARPTPALIEPNAEPEIADKGARP